jgi:hypothetical protein
VFTIDTSFLLIERLLGFNKSYYSLARLRILATSGANDYILEDGLLFYQGRLLVPDADNLRTELVKEAHEQPSTAHPGTRKTYELLKEKYC